ncbi:MAG: glycerophosphoryl diester phosphodiesterase membrane domain-containing protein [Alphaproteobacteria bacterium]|nr:glycerophosphoryl diester phosphodiesterase membrane domain-containing protein [Alphaproteobacteria bacterium]
MANRKLDMGKAWTQATGLIGANRDTISALAGLFFFLPALALALFAPELANPEAAPPASADPQVAMQAVLDQMTQAYADNWPLIAAVSVLQFIGSLSLLALLTDRGRPTVREALSNGLGSTPSYFAAQVLSALAVALAIGLPVGLIAAAGSPVAAVLVGIVLAVAGIYVFIKFSLIAPVIAIEGVRNPIIALARSWRLTKGNSLRIFGFFILLFLTIGIIAALVTGIFAVVFSAFDSQVASIGNGLGGAVINSGLTVLFLVVVAAIHRQLAGQSPEGLAATFE